MSKKQFSMLVTASKIASSLIFVAIIVTLKIWNMQLSDGLKAIEERIDTAAADTPSLPSREDTLVAMATAIAIQETKCNNIVSADGRYAGYLQISEAMVAEANNILGYECYHTKGYIDDRRDWYGSLAIMTTIMDRYNPQLDIDKAVDIWNKYCPATYRKQVKTYYEFLLNRINNE